MHNTQADSVRPTVASCFTLFQWKEKNIREINVFQSANFVREPSSSSSSSSLSCLSHERTWIIHVTRARTHEHIRWHFAVRSRPIQSRPNRKMSRNVGNWKAYSYFFDTRSRMISRIMAVLSFRMLNARGAQLSVPSRRGMRKGGGCSRSKGRERGEDARGEEKRGTLMRFICRKRPCTYTGVRVALLRWNLTIFWSALERDWGIERARSPAITIKVDAARRARSSFLSSTEVRAQLATFIGAFDR